MNIEINNVSEKQPLNLPAPQGNGLRGMPASTIELKKIKRVTEVEQTFKL